MTKVAGKRRERLKDQQKKRAHVTDKIALVNITVKLSIIALISIENRAGAPNDSFLQYT